MSDQIFNESDVLKFLQIYEDIATPKLYHNKENSSLSNHWSIDVDISRQNNFKMDTEKFINSFRAEESLWNTFYEEYKNKNIRKAALGRLAAESNISGLVLSIFSRFFLRFIFFFNATNNCCGSNKFNIHVYLLILSIMDNT